MSFLPLFGWAPILALLYVKSFFVNTVLHETIENRDLCDATTSEVILRSVFHTIFTFLVLAVFVRRRYLVALLEGLGLFALAQAQILIPPPQRSRHDPLYVQLAKQGYEYLYPLLHQLLYVWLAYLLEYSK